MARVLVVGGLLALAFAVYAAADCALAERQRIRALPRWTWILVILLLPVLGGALWFAFGRAAPERPLSVRATGPDDDPAFLRTVRARHGSDEPDWLRLEQEFADPDDDGETRRR